MKNYVAKILLVSVLLFWSTSFRTQAAETCIPNVSVIIPVYNTSNYLKDCLDSVLAQSLKNIEIICVNDGSTDDSLEIIDDYAKKDSRIKIINQENKGGAAARNAGMEIASGEFIAFMDSDDTIDSDAYEKSYERAKENDADILMFGEDRIAIPDEICIDGFSALNISGSMMLWNKLYRRSFLENNSFLIPEHASCYHDECFNSVVLSKAERVACIKERFYHYRRKRMGSIQNSVTLKNKSDNILIYARYVCDHWQKNDYIQEHGFWILKEVSSMSNRIVGKIGIDEAQAYSNLLMNIIGDKIYNLDNIEKLSDFEKRLLNNWTQYIK